MKTEIVIDKAILANLCSVMNASMDAFVRLENKWIVTLGKVWNAFLSSKDGGVNHWTYFDEGGFATKGAAREFRAYVKLAAEKGGWNPVYVASFLPSVDELFVMRKREAGEKRTVKVKFSDAQIAAVKKMAKACDLSKEDIKKLIVAMRAK